ncbi:GAF domain-containing protein [Novosphingobium soli]|uniref:histidine kinase n=1 Tax=Novosphingobium soli TaxID=574956 RepID=A0ABV6CV40_9SPHN
MDSVSAKWPALFAVAERLARVRTLDEVVEVVRSSAREIVGADGIAFVRCEADRCAYIAEDGVGPLWAGQSFPLSDCVSGWVMRNGEAAVIPDIYTDERVPHALYRDTFVRSMVMVPVRTGGASFAIGAYWARTGAPPPDALQLLQLLGGNIGIALGNVALHDSFEVLNRTAAAVAAERDIDRVVQLITDAGVELTGAEFGAFFYNLVDERGESYMLYSLSGVPRESFAAFPMPRNTAVFAPTFGGEAVVRSDNIRLDPRYGHNAPRQGMPEGHLPVTSYLAVPVVSRSGEVHGGLFFGHHREGVFNQEHESVLLGMAGHAAIAIDNARLNQVSENELGARRLAESELRDLNATLERRIEQRTEEIRAAFEQLEESERRFRILVDGVSDYAIYMLDADGYITNWNAGAERIKGYTAQEIVGRHLSTFYTPRDREAGMPARTLETARRTGKFEAEGWRLRRDGTEFWASVVVDAIRDEEGTLIGFAKITRDLTERRAVEERLRQSQKMEAVGQLTGGIAHDFNNLLTVISGNLDIAARVLGDGEGTARARRSIGNAMKGAERAAALTQRLLAFARRQPLSPEPLDLDTLVAGMSELLNRALGELVKLDVAGTPGLWPVEADPNQMENALINLAVNARDAMPAGGTLRITTANARIETSQGDVPPGSYVLLTVSDTGCGMPPEHLTRVFEPFFTTKEVGRGTGLGLSQVYGFVKQSGGHVVLHSEEGRGTSVEMYLPRFVGTLVEGEEAETLAVDERSGRGETILVVEDDDEVRAFSAEILRELGYRVIEASDGPTALRTLEEVGSTIDLVFTDVVMPGMSGKDLGDELRRRRPGLGMLFTSGYTGNTISPAERIDPEAPLLAKPFTSSELAERVRDLIDAAATRRLAADGQS